MRHVKDEKTIVADALWILDMEDNPSDTHPGDEAQQPLEYSFVWAEDVEADGFPMPPALIQGQGLCSYEPAATYRSLDT